MVNINEKIYLEKFEKSPNSIKLFISNIFLDKNFSIFVEKYRASTVDKELIVDTIRSEVLMYVLEFSTTEQFIDNIVELLELTPDEAESVISDLFLICIPKEIQSIIDTDNSSSEENKLEEVKLTEKTESAHISHQDLLSEIENPTPSISTTTDFQNRVAQVSVQSTQNSQSVNASKASSISSITPATSSTSTSTNPATTTNSTQNPSLHSSDPSVTPYTNPALHIATKLDQNLGGPTSSIPKDVYVSKKPDPYHEPVDL